MISSVKQGWCFFTLVPIIKNLSLWLIFQRFKILAVCSSILIFLTLLLLFESGFTIQEVQDRLGHSDLKTTMNIYAHVTEKQRDNMADKFAKFMAL